MRATPESRSFRAIGVAGLLVCCTVLGLAGTDLVLPAVPGLPESLGGTIAQAQFVLATFAAGTGIGLLLFGELGSFVDHRRMLASSLLAYGLLSAAAATATSLELLIALRFLQGVAASCAAVVTPGMVRALFDEQGALRALGALGSIESLAPAIAPIIGVWLLSSYGWSASFWVTAVLAVLLSVLVLLSKRYIPAVPGNPSRMGYWLLIRNPVFQRYALSQGFSLGSLLAFVFAMPTVYVVAFGGDIKQFIVMQLLGISTYIVAANLSSRLVRRFGAERTIYAGSILALLGSIAMLSYGFLGGREPWVIWLLFLPFNMGFGFRGPPGFYCSLQASDGDDARASALVILYVMLITAAATALISPFVASGLWPAALAASVLGGMSLLILPLLPSLPES
ncbi:MFS transporter [Congregibacter brevis]|uniref:MFS transporter n=1 Tax=Congregibacter brevis TaxID=3081201 RepID=A0ABZ0I9V3_9GAMM|nr:MFS transporter [Congregibacter sp. IMCC45268]